MKTFRLIQKIMGTIGLVYGLALSNKVDAGSEDIRTGFIVVLLSMVIFFSLVLRDSHPEKRDGKDIYGELE